MANEKIVLGKVAPTYEGVWSSEKKYEKLDIVSSDDKTLAYIAKKAVPAGTALSNETYWASVLDVRNVLNNVKSTTTTIDEKLGERTTDIERLSDGHLHRIVFDAEHDMIRYTETDGVISEISATKGSDYIPCPRNLCFEFENSDARCYLYFYDYDDGAYTINWDVLNTTTNAGAKNYINVNSIKTNMLKIPSGMYMKIAVAVGDVKMYGWDGEMFGMPLSADSTMITSGGETSTLHADGSSGLTIPGTAEYVCCNNSSIFAIQGYKDGVFEDINTAYAKNFFRFPVGYDFFRCRLYFGEPSHLKITRVNDVSDWISVGINSSHELSSARARKVIDACKTVCNFAWTPREALLVRGDASPTFKALVEYNGVPYSGQWTSSHYIGWHVSPHTFVNALADTDSVIYKEMVASGGTEALYYGLVCSSFATMCDGWPCPQTNAGFIYDPMVTVNYTANPPLGSIYSNIQSHCLIPERTDHSSNIDAVSMYESAIPVCGKRTRYSNINSAADKDSYKDTYLDGYLDDYGYVAHHTYATTPLSTAPYSDFSDINIVNAGVLPYKGDRCVHTSLEENVYVNVKDSAASKMFLIAPDGAESSVVIASGTMKIDIRSMLTNDGIYAIYTDTNTTASMLEYHNVEPIKYAIKNGVINFSRNDFWYASVYFRGARVFGTDSSKICCVLGRNDGDYSDWSNGSHYVSSAACVFYKGQYGAYVVPLEKSTSI